MPRPPVPAADRKVPFTVNMTSADRDSYNAACFADGQQPAAAVARRLLLEYTARVKRGQLTGSAQ